MRRDTSHCRRCWI